VCGGQPGEFCYVYFECAGVCIAFEPIMVRSGIDRILAELRACVEANQVSFVMCILNVLVCALPLSPSRCPQESTGYWRSCVRVWKPITWVMFVRVCFVCCDVCVWGP
jgi:hypothetical protein